MIGFDDRVHDRRRLGGAARWKCSSGSRRFRASASASGIRCRARRAWSDAVFAARLRGGDCCPKALRRAPKKRVKPLRLAGRRAIQRGLRETCLAIGVSRHKHLCRRLWTLYACGYAKRRDRRIRPARTLLDKLLLDAAAQAGAEVRKASVESIVCEGDRVTGVRGHGKGGATVTEHARVVIGADGRPSRVAQAVNASQYNEKPRRFETYVRPTGGMAAWPTNDDLTVVIAGWPYAEFEANKKDIEGNFFKTYDLAPSFAERLRAGTRETRLWVRQYRTTSASPTVRDGHWSVMPGTTRTSLRRREFTMLCAMPNSASRPWMGHLEGLAPSRPPWLNTRRAATSMCCRCTNSPRTWRPRAAAARTSAALGCHGRQSGSNGWVRTGQCRRDISGRVL